MVSLGNNEYVPCEVIADYVTLVIQGNTKKAKRLIWKVSPFQLNIDEIKEQTRSVNL